MKKTLIVLAALCFLLTGFGWKSTSVELLPIGLAIYMLSQLVDEKGKPVQTKAEG